MLVLMAFEWCVLKRLSRALTFSSHVQVGVSGYLPAIVAAVAAANYFAENAAALLLACGIAS